MAPYKPMLLSAAVTMKMYFTVRARCCWSAAVTMKMCSTATGWGKPLQEPVWSTPTRCRIFCDLLESGQWLPFV